MFFIFKLKRFFLLWLFKSISKDICFSMNSSRNFKNLKFFENLYRDIKEIIFGFEKNYVLLYKSSVIFSHNGDTESCNPWLNRFNKELLKRINDLEILERKNKLQNANIEST